MADYFIKVEDAKDLRRDILLGSKESIHILKQERDILALRAHKRSLMEKARRNLKELTFLLTEFEKGLPLLTKKELSELMPEAVKRKTSAKKHQGKKKGKAAAEKKEDDKPKGDVSEAQQELSKLERLEHTLGMIEDRLNKL